MVHAILQSLFTVLVIRLPLPVIIQHLMTSHGQTDSFHFRFFLYAHLIRVRYVSELVFGTGIVRVLVGVIFHRQLAVCPLYLFS